MVILSFFAYIVACGAAGACGKGLSDFVYKWCMATLLYFIALAVL